MKQYGFFRKHKTIFYTALCLALYAFSAPFVQAQGAVGVAAQAVINPTGLMADISSAILSMFGLLTSLAGGLLNAAIQMTVVQMSGFVNQIEAINLSWRIFRDFANIFFIFILLYAAIQTILRTANFQVKQLVMRLIIVALLVNFSLFFTKAIVDVSNIIALQFYNGISICEGGTTPEGECYEYKGLSDAFRDALQLTSVLSPTSGKVFEPDNLLAVTLVGSIFLLITMFVFFAGAILFVVRFATLIILMILAPFACVFAILPQTKQYWSKWWQTLLRQAIFAPVYLALTYIAIRIVNDPHFKIMLYGGSLDTEIVSPTGTALATLGFGIVATLLISTLVLSQKMGMAGSTTIIGWGNTAKNWASSKVKAMPSATYRNTVSRGAHNLTNSDALLDTASKKGLVGMTARYGLKKVNKMSKPYKESVEEYKKEKVEMSKLLKTPDRKRQYATAVGESKLARLGLWVPQKNKEAADAIRKEAGINAKKTATISRPLSKDPKQGFDKSATKEIIKEFKDALGKMSDKEITKLDKLIVTNKEVASRLSSSQLKAVIENEDYDEDIKTEVKDMRLKGLEEMLADPTRISEDIMKRGAKEISKLDVKIITDARLSTSFNTDILRKIMDEEVPPEERVKIREALKEEIDALEDKSKSFSPQDTNRLKQVKEWLEKNNVGKFF